jgi:hypothetical protein
MKKLLLILLCFLTITSYSQKKNNYAKDIEVSTDKFDDKTTWNSPYTFKTYGQIDSERVWFSKIKNDDVLTYYLRLSTTGITLNIDGKGAIVLFTDGDRIEFPELEISVDVANGSSWEYSVFTSITIEQLDKFINKDIDAFKLYIYESNVSKYPEKVKKKRKQIKGWAQAIKDAI